MHNKSDVSQAFPDFVVTYLCSAEDCNFVTKLQDLQDAPQCAVILTFIFVVPKKCPVELCQIGFFSIKSLNISEKDCYN